MEEYKPATDTLKQKIKKYFLSVKKMMKLVHFKTLFQFSLGRQFINI